MWSSEEHVIPGNTVAVQEDKPFRALSKYVYTMQNHKIISQNFDVQWWPHGKLNPYANYFAIFGAFMIHIEAYPYTYIHADFFSVLGVGVNS